MGHVPLSLPQLVILHDDEPRPQVRRLLEWAAVEQAHAELNGSRSDPGLLTRSDDTAQDAPKPSGKGSGAPAG